MDRKTIGAGVLDNSPQDLERWIAHTQAIKPGSDMPTMSLKARDLEALTGYLSTLH